MPGLASELGPEIARELLGRMYSDRMEIEFVGAAQTVTGSMHVVRTARSTLLLECGLFQGRRAEAAERNRRLGVDPRTIDAVVLSHAHIDHSGLLPLLYRRGYRGPVYCTNATRDLCVAMLEDAAMIQASDARYVNKLAARGVPGILPIEPLYTLDDVVGLIGLMEGLPYHRKQRIAPDVELTFYDAGHVLGSAIVALDVDDEGRDERVVFSGDLGRKNMPILRDPEVPTRASVLLLESTYGNRHHRSFEALEDDLAKVVGRTIGRGGKVIIPSFALERAQEVIYALKLLAREGRIPKIPVYVDSPLTVKITDVFRLHPDCYDEEARRMLGPGDSPFEFPGLTYVESVEQSKSITASTDPCIIIAASGMCESGRILHHLQAGIGDERTTVLIVGFQAQHTLGRRLVEGRNRVRIFGVERERRAEIVSLDGFSAHADQTGLLSFAEELREKGPLRQVALVHGEPPAQAVLKAKLEERGFPSVIIPAAGDRLRV